MGPPGQRLLEDGEVGTGDRPGLVQGQVDAAALSFDSFDKAIGEGAVDPRTIRVVARSIAIPYPPIVMSSRLPAPLKARLKWAFAGVATVPEHPETAIRGPLYSGDSLELPIGVGVFGARRGDDARGFHRGIGMRFRPRGRIRSQQDEFRR